MTNHPNVTDQVRELASTYALGLLEAPQTIEFEQHLSACDVCRSEVKAFREVTGELAYAVPMVRPAPRLKQELLRKLAFEHVLVRADDASWEPTPFPGVELRRLFVDE